jgi:hypothetical protein
LATADNMKPYNLPRVGGVVHDDVLRIASSTSVPGQNR